MEKEWRTFLKPANSFARRDWPGYEPRSKCHVSIGENSATSIAKHRTLVVVGNNDPISIACSSTNKRPDQLPVRQSTLLASMQTVLCYLFSSFREMKEGTIGMFRLKFFHEDTLVCGYTCVERRTFVTMELGYC